MICYDTVVGIIWNINYMLRPVNFAQWGGCDVVVQK